MYEAPTHSTCNSITMVHFQDTECPTLLDENVHGIRFSNPAQNGQIHRNKYYQILILNFNYTSYQ